MSREVLAHLLKGSPFIKYLDIEPYGLQLPSFIATAYGLKPAMDMWVRSDAWSSFRELANSLGLHWHVDAYFDRNPAAVSKIQSPVKLTTTRALLSKKFRAQEEAHVFVARSQQDLFNSVCAGWYPLIVNGRIIDKHLADHENFGQALGYPQCCRDFFRANNNWHYENTYYAAYKNTKTVPQSLSNGLLRHTAFSFTPHIACSFICESTINYGAKLLALVAQEVSVSYADEISRRLATPILCLSELKIYRFEGRMQLSNQVQYSAVEPVNPTRCTDSLYKMLNQGDKCIIDSNVLRIYAGKRQIHAYQARADQHGPEFPFIIQCVT